MQNIWLAKHPTFFLRVIVQTTQRTRSPCVVRGGEITRPTFQRFGSSNKDILYTHNIPSLLRKMTVVNIKRTDSALTIWLMCILAVEGLIFASPPSQISCKISEINQSCATEIKCKHTYIYIYNNNGNMIAIITHQIKKQHTTQLTTAWKAGTNEAHAIISWYYQSL